ncbi:MAG: transcriptional regulator, LuxR family [Acidimicrobiales bacterium]|nr:transcriptional regulator, LuxR family [Acidimicrobiales bacterium]
MVGRQGLDSRGWPLAQRDAEVDAVTLAIEEEGLDSVVIYGPPGVGKSRLAGTCLELARASGLPTAQVIASQASGQLPLGALAPILPAELSRDATPAAIFDSARRELLSLGGDGRLVLFVDDAHLLDNSSAVLLTQLLDAEAVFVLVTIREGEPAPDAVVAWWRRSGAMRLDLGDLGPDATAEVLALALGGIVGVDVVQRLHQASAGNPLLLRELVHQSLDGGQLSDETGTWCLTGEITASPHLVDVLAPRLAALSEPARRVVDHLAVCAPLGIAELIDDVDRAELEALERSGLVRLVVDGHRMQLVLGHPLYGEALRAELSELHRRRILLATAERIEALGARRREDTGRVATWRLDAGGNPDPGLLLQAARVARHTHDYKQVERLAAVLWESDHTVEVAVLLGEAHYELGHFDAAETVLAAPVPADSAPDLLVQRAVIRAKNWEFGLCDSKAALALLQEAQATVPPELALFLVVREAGAWMFAGHHQKALDVLATVQPRTAEARVAVAVIRGNALIWVGRTAEAIEVTVEGFQEHCQLTEPLALAHPGIHLANQACALIEAGRFAEADSLAQAGFEVTLADNNTFAQIIFSCMLGKSCVQQGRVQESVRWLREATSTARLDGWPGFERLSLSALAGSEALLGNTAASSAAVAEAAGLPAFEFLRFNQANGWAWAAWGAGDTPRARTLLAHSAAEAAAVHDVGTAAWLWHDAARLGVPDVGGHLAGLAARSDSPVVAARARHVDALEADDAEGLSAAADGFEELGMVLLAAEAAAAAAEVHGRRGDLRLGAACANRARSLADRCPGVRTPGLERSAPAVSLSARELEIASLASDGWSSQDIAERLVLSVRTVNNHLGKVYSKLGVNRRDQLADVLGGQLRAL